MVFTKTIFFTNISHNYELMIHFTHVKALKHILNFPNSAVSCLSTQAKMSPNAFALNRFLAGNLAGVGGAKKPDILVE